MNARLNNVVAYTRIGSLYSFLFINRKKPVSIPYVNITINKAVQAYRFVTIPKSLSVANTRVYIGTSIQFRNFPTMLLTP